MSDLANWNGIIMPLQDVRIPATDRGYLFGDSVYEVIRVYNSRPFLLDSHIDRLENSLRSLAISYDLSKIKTAIAELLRISAAQEAIIYIQISRGDGVRRHIPPPGLKPNCLIYIQSLPRRATLDRRKTGIKVGIMPDLRHQLCAVKTTNLLANILAMVSAQEQGFSEALLINAKGNISEGPQCNFAIFKGSVLITPPLSENILPGITRAHTLKLAREKLKLEIREETISKTTLYSADEVFLLGTTTELAPVVAVDDQQIGSGQPGPLTRQLCEAFDESILS